MGLFRRDESVPAFVSGEQIAALREYVSLRLKEYEAEQCGEEQYVSDSMWLQESGIRYSLAFPENDSGISDMQKLVEEARKDNALFDHPALQKAYHRWERETAVRKSFSSEVMRILKERNLRPAAFYKSAQIDKRVFHSLKQDYLYKPSRETAFRCCAALKLSFEEASGLLELAGYSLSPGDSRDLVLRFCLENRIWDIYSINSMLGAMGEKELR